MQQMSPKEYNQYVSSLSPSSPSYKNVLFAFLIGGAICAIAQLIRTGWMAVGFDEEMAGTLTSITVIFCGALLTGLSVFDDIAKVAGAGTLVPITGFSNAMVSPAMEYRSEGLVMGVAAKMFTIAGPVLVFGISASVIYGIILVILEQFGKLFPSFPTQRPRAGRGFSVSRPAFFCQNTGQGRGKIFCRKMIEKD